MTISTASQREPAVPGRLLTCQNQLRLVSTAASRWSRPYIAIVLVGILSTVVVVGVGNLTSTGSAAACTASADAANTGVNTYFATNAAYPTSLTQLTSAVPPALVLPSGVSIDASGLVASSTGWTMAMSTDGSGGPPVFLCGGDLPAGFTIGPNGRTSTGSSRHHSPTNAAAIAARSVTSGPLTGYLVSVTSSAERTPS